jgi:hypothetical protein
MAYDEALAERVRQILTPRSELSERAQDLTGWVDAGADFGSSLSPKQRHSPQQPDH